MMRLVVVGHRMFVWPLVVWLIVLWLRVAVEPWRLLIRRSGTVPVVRAVARSVARRGMISLRLPAVRRQRVVLVRVVVGEATVGLASVAVGSIRRAVAAGMAVVARIRLVAVIR